MKTNSMNADNQVHRVNHFAIIFWGIMLMVTCWLTFIQMRGSFPSNSIPGIFVSLSGLANFSRPLVRQESLKKCLLILTVMFAVVGAVIAILNIVKYS
jgi:predicted neutral ceramidase superfamily lipid hydrolase